MRTKALGRGLLASGLAMLTLGLAATPASAYVAAPDLDAAVYARRDSLGQSLIQGAFFWVQDLDQDGANRADGTPDGQGAFQWFIGNNGSGGVYAHRRNGGISSGAVYGQILSSWAANGYELGKGYPFGVESSLTGPCPVGTARMQVFRRLGSNTVQRACWGNAAGRDQYNVRWLTY